VEAKVNAQDHLSVVTTPKNAGDKVEILRLKKVGQVCDWLQPKRLGLVQTSRAVGKHTEHGSEKKRIREEKC